jgi:hypothetical protein
MAYKPNFKSDIIFGSLLNGSVKQPPSIKMCGTGKSYCIFYFLYNIMSIKKTQSLLSLVQILCLRQ